jgi:hypothetical protein
MTVFVVGKKARASVEMTRLGIGGESLAGGVVNDDLPALVGLFEDQGEEAFGVASVFFAAIEMIFADDYGEALVERMGFELGEAEGSHRGPVGVVAAVGVEHALEAAVDYASDEDGVGGVFVGLGEGVKIASVPGGFLGQEDLDDVELCLGNWLELVVLSVCAAGCSERKQKSESEDGEMGTHGVTSWVFSITVANV